MISLDLGDLERVPVRRPAGPARRRRRHRAARGARRARAPARPHAHRRRAARWPRCRSTPGWAGCSSRPTATAACARCWSSPPRCRSRTRASGPTEQRQAADAKHARFADDGSDFLAFLNLWSYLAEQRAELSGNRFRRLCARSSCTTCASASGRTCTPSSARPRRNAGMTLNDVAPADADRIHIAVLAGLLVAASGLREARDARSTSAPAAPSSRSSPARRWPRSRRAG